MIRCNCGGTMQTSNHRSKVTPEQLSVLPILQKERRAELLLSLGASRLPIVNTQSTEQKHPSENGTVVENNLKFTDGERWTNWYFTFCKEKKDQVY